MDILLNFSEVKENYMNRGLIPAIMLLLLTFSCAGGDDVIKTGGSDVVTASWTGKAKIVSTGKPGESCSGEKDYIDVRFDFTPDDPRAVTKYLACDVSDKNILLFYDNRHDLHKNWILKWGLKQGNVYRAVRHENTLNSKGNRASFEVFLEPR